MLKVFSACLLCRGDNGEADRKFLEALHYFPVHNITWRALPAEFGNWNSTWMQFWRLWPAGVFKAKGRVEKKGVVVRQRFFTPRLRVKSFEELNAWLLDRCVA